MIYCIATTNGHPSVTAHPSIISPIDDLLLREACDVVPTPFNGTGHEGIDGDELAEQVHVAAGRPAPGKSKSVDLVFGLVSRRYQFVECKFRSNSFQFLDKSDIQEKVSGTLNDLGVTTSISPNYYLVFKTNKVQQARNYLFRQHPVLSSKYEAIDVKMLFNIFFL